MVRKIKAHSVHVSVKIQYREMKLKIDDLDLKGLF